MSKLSGKYIRSVLHEKCNQCIFLKCMMTSVYQKEKCLPSEMTLLMSANEPRIKNSTGGSLLEILYHFRLIDQQPISLIRLQNVIY